jgi:hypothetical protein
MSHFLQLITRRCGRNAVCRKSTSAIQWYYEKWVDHRDIPQIGEQY